MNNYINNWETTSKEPKKSKKIEKKKEIKEENFMQEA